MPSMPSGAASWYWDKVINMQPVYIVSSAATPVAENYHSSLRDLAAAAFHAALKGLPAAFDPQRIGMLYVASAMNSILERQTELGALLATTFGMVGIPALTVEASGASGGVALHQAHLAIASGAADLVAVVGVEKVTDRLDADIEAARATSIDSEFEAELGLTLTSQWALLMRRYMHEYGYAADAFAPFPINAHANAASNPGALYRFGINADKYRKATQIASPLNMLDTSTAADGAAVVLLASEPVARELGAAQIRLAGGAIATDALPLAARRDLLWLAAAERSSRAAMQQAQVGPADVQVLDVTDPHGIVAAMVLEACGFVERGTAPRHAADGGITPQGSTPLATAGGYKARGDVGGASGVYQIVELVRQLQGTAGAAQVANARVALAQCLGGVGSTAATHILIRD